MDVKLATSQFSDMLLYTSKGVAGTSHFRIRGLLPLRGMLVSGLAPCLGFPRGAGLGPTHLSPAEVNPNPAALRAAPAEYLAALGAAPAGHSLLVVSVPHGHCSY